MLVVREPLVFSPKGVNVINTKYHNTYPPGATPSPTARQRSCLLPANDNRRLISAYFPAGWGPEAERCFFLRLGLISAT